jgi:hypothetical protein
MPPEQLRAFPRIGVRLDAAELGILFAPLDGLDAELGENFRQIGARFGDQLVREKIAVAVENAQHGRL